MTTTIGIYGSEATVPDPVKESHQPVYELVGASGRTLNATRIRHVVTQKRRWPKLEFICTSAEKTTLTTELDREADLHFLSPDGSTATVQADSYEVERLTSGMYSVRVSLEEV